VSKPNHHLEDEIMGFKAAKTPRRPVADDTVTAPGPVDTGTEGDKPADILEFKPKPEPEPEPEPEADDGLPFEIDEDAIAAARVLLTQIREHFDAEDQGYLDLCKLALSVLARTVLEQVS
jgi:hypothetical protein